MALYENIEAQNATSGTSNKPWQASGVSIDSRTVNAGDLFFAIIGDNNDGHNYVKLAQENGAAAAVVSYVPEDVNDDFPLLVVEDTTEALWDLAN